VGSKSIYLDPAKPIDFSGKSKADLILITDIHGDHMDPESIKAVSKNDTEILGPPTVVQIVTTGKAIANGETKTWQEWTVQAIPAYNLKRVRRPVSSFMTRRGNGYVLTYGGKLFYFSGDTEGVPEMRALQNIDVAFVCMNLPYPMPPDEAAEAVKAFHPKIVIPYHYRGSDLSIGFSFLMLGLHERDPLRSLVRGIPRFTFSSLAFATSLGDPSGLENRVAGIPFEDYALV
jgi:L-ascorbate metabolism protein UlaG (beta-lactamase superfamily)